jgi:hypothetical protein
MGAPPPAGFDAIEDGDWAGEQDGSSVRSADDAAGGRRGRPETWSLARVVREALAAVASEALAEDLAGAACAVATVPLPSGRVRVAVDGGPAAGSNMAPPSPFAGFDTIQDAYLEYLALADAPARLAFTREHANYKTVLGVPPFDQGPGDIAVFTVIYEIIRKLNHMLLVGSFYGTQEELGGVARASHIDCLAPEPS